MATVSNIKNEIKKQITNLVLEQAKQVFERHESLTSFGWNQFTSKCGSSHTKKYSVYHTVNTPHINGNIGAYLDHNTDVSKDVIETLKQFDIEHLLISFGDDSDICVYRDLTYEVSPII